MERIGDGAGAVRRSRQHLFATVLFTVLCTSSKIVKLYARCARSGALSRHVLHPAEQHEHLEGGGHVRSGADERRPEREGELHVDGRTTFECNSASHLTSQPSCCSRDTSASALRQREGLLAQWATATPRAPCAIQTHGLSSTYSPFSSLLV